MKHSSTRELYGYWDGKRAGAIAPNRSDLEPGPIRGLLGDIFVLSCDPAKGYPFRFAGTRVCALLGHDVKGDAFTALFGAAHRREMEDMLGAVVGDKLAAVAGLTGTGPAGQSVALEMLLLPFNARAHSPISLTGLLVPFQDGHHGLTRLSLLSHRYMGHPPQRFAPRLLKKLAVARGLMVYEGLI